MMRKASDIAAILALAVSVIAMGGVHTSVAFVAALLALVAAGTSLQSLGHVERRPIVSLMGVAFAVATVLCLIQLIPLPGLFHALLNPTEHALWLEGASLAGISDPGWRPLSLDPWETADRGVRYAALALMSLWAGNLRGRNRWQDVASWIVAIAAAALALGAGLHFSGAETFLGLYAPEVGFRGPSPFISTNHGAAFFGFASIVAGSNAFAYRTSSARRATVFGLASVVFLAATFANGSDGANLAILFTILLAGVFQWLRKGRALPAREVTVGAALVAALGIGLALWLDIDSVAGAAASRVAFSGEHGARLALMNAAWTTSLDFWRFGAGAGAVGTVVPAAVDWAELVPASIPFVENDTFELLISFGWLLGLGLVAAYAAQLVLGARRALGKRKSPRVAVATISAVYFALIAQLHFPLFALGLSVVAVAWLDVLWSRRSKSTGDGRFFDTGHLAMTHRAAIVVVAVLGLSVLTFGAARVAWLEDRELAETPSKQRLEREIWLRPGNPAPYVKLATAAVKRGETEQAVKLADFALSRENSPRMRLYRARVLAQHAPDEAVAVFKVLLADGHRSQRVLDGLTVSFDRPADLVAALADSPDTWDDAVRRIAAHHNQDVVSSVVIGLVEAHPNDVRAYRVASSAYLAMKQPVLAQLWAEHADELELSSEGGERLAPLLMARSLRAAGDFEGARKVLDGLAEQDGTVPQIHREALQLRSSLGPDALEFITSHHAALCRSPVPTRDQVVCWRTEAWMADVKGDTERAVTLLRLVYRRHGQLAPLATYLAKVGRCGDLRQLQRRVDGRGAELVENLLGRCAPR